MSAREAALRQRVAELEAGDTVLWEWVALQAAADAMAAIIEGGDVAECAGHVPGEVGRSAAIDARDGLLEDPVGWLREWADKRRSLLASEGEAQGESGDRLGAVDRLAKLADGCFPGDLQEAVDRVREGGCAPVPPAAQSARERWLKALDDYPELAELAERWRLPPPGDAPPAGSRPPESEES